MLRLLRQGGVTKALMGTVVVLIIAAFAFTDLSGGGGASAQGNICVVKVEDRCVSVKDYNMLVRLAAPAGATNKQLRKGGYQKHAIDALIERELLLAQAKELGVSISDEALDDELSIGRVHFSWPVDAPTPGALQQGRPFPTSGAAPMVTYFRVRNSKTDAFDYNVYKRQVQNILRMSPKEFKRKQRSELIAARVRAMLTSSVRVSDDEAYFLYDRQRSTATARYVKAQNTWFEKFGARVEPEAVATALTEHKEELDKKWETVKSRYTAGCPLVSEILFRFPPGADADERAEQKEAADEAAELLRKRVPFEVVARAYSAAREAKLGGALGCLTKEYGGGSEDLLAAVKELKPARTSKIIETPRGFHILRYHGDLEESAIESTARNHLATELLIKRQGEDRAKSFVENLIRQVGEGKALADSVKELLPTSTVWPDAVSEQYREKLVARAQQARDVPRVEVGRSSIRGGNAVSGAKDTSVSNQLFELAKVDDVVPQPVEVFGGWAVAQLKERELVSKEDFEKEKADLLRALKEQKRSDALSKYITRLRKQAKKIKIHEQYDPSVVVPQESAANAG